MLSPAQGNILSLGLPAGIEVPNAKPVVVLDAEVLEEHSLDSVSALGVAVDDHWAVEFDIGEVVWRFVLAYWYE